jgi:hypothetical protein
MNIRSEILRFIAEMLVVFVGVYSAFALDTARSERAESHRLHQFLEAMQKDFQDSEDELSASLPTIFAVIDSLVEAHDSGKMPRIGHLSMWMSFRSRAWEAMLQSGGINLLDVDFVLAVEDYYTLIERLSAELVESRQMSANLILPRMNEGNETFYDPQTNRLKPAYRWYLSELRTYRDLLEQIRDQNTDLLERIGTMTDGA